MAKSKKKTPEDFQYDVALSFAGENRSYVEKVATALLKKGIRTFYDEYERVELWGKDLYAHLDDVYRNVAYYCVMFISRHYERKLWTNHERRSAQARAFRENREYVLPARFDSTAIPGVPETVGYIDLRKTKPEKLAEMIAKKLGPRKVVNFLPPECDRLYKTVAAKTAKRKNIVQTQAQIFSKTLQRMSEDERRVFLTALYHGCTAELPDNVHVSLDLVRRCTGFHVAKIKRLLAGMVSLGIHCRVLQSSHHDFGTEGEMAYLDWDIRALADHGGNAIAVSYEMVHVVTSCYCEEHGMEVLLRGDFSQLSSETSMEHEH
jgi:TIR domain